MGNNQFLQYAKIVFQKMLGERGYIDTDMYEDNQEYEEILAQCLQVFAYHVVLHTTPASGSTILKYVGKDCGEITRMLPDLTEEALLTEKRQSVE